jgi:hypothetical protein
VGHETIARFHFLGVFTGNCLSIKNAELIVKGFSFSLSHRNEAQPAAAVNGKGNAKAQKTSKTSTFAAKEYVSSTQQEVFLIKL